MRKQPKGLNVKVASLIATNWFCNIDCVLTVVKDFIICNTGGDSVVKNINFFMVQYNILIIFS